MNKFLLVMWHEYTRHVFRKRFLLSLISMPLLIVVMLGISIFAQILTANNTPVGYIDQSGFLAHPQPQPPSDNPFHKTVQMIAYQNEADAKSALENGKIQAYYILAADYPQSKIQLFYLKEPDTQTQSQFTDFLRTNLIAGQPDEVIRRLTDGTNFIAMSADGKRQMGENEWFNILVPLFAGMLFVFTIMGSGGYLMQAVVEEKENRTMEIVVTSVSPDQLMNGKIVGDMAIGLTQISFWLVFTILGVLISRNYIDWVRQIRITSDFVWVVLLTTLPSFVMIAALMAAIGATVTETREAQQISGLFVLPVMIPYYLIFSFMDNPNGPVPVGLSLFPLTAPVALPLRMGLTQVPIWQTSLSVVLLVICAAAALWLAARAFRLGMLSYGKRISLRQIFSKAGNHA